jgi:hypothetical protein
MRPAGRGARADWGTRVTGGSAGEPGAAARRNVSRAGTDVMRYTEAIVTTSSNRDGSRRKPRGSASRTASSKKTPRKTAERPRRAPVVEPPPEPAAPERPAVAVDEVENYPLPAQVSAVEPTFAARVPPPEPERPRPPGRRAIFLDVENTSRAQHLAHVIDHLGVDPWDRRTELVAVANWRVVGHEAARLLAARGAHLVHSAPSTGVRDWSDLRIAVAAGIWLAAARPGDIIEIVSDDRAFDAVGDVAASLGIEFRRLSYRRMKEESPDTGVETEVRPPAVVGSGSRRRRRRRGRGPGSAPPEAADRRPLDSRDGGRHPGHGGPRSSRGAGMRGRPAPSHQTPRPPAEPSQTTAPHDELVSVVRGLVEASPRRSVSIDAVANALKSRGFQRPPGSPRLVTRLRRIRELVVSQSGTITLAEDAAPHEPEPRPEAAAPPAESERGPEEARPESDLDDDDRQPDYLNYPDREPELPEVDGNRAEPLPGQSHPARGGGGASGRRRRRRRWRGGPRQPSLGQPQG